MDVQGTEASGFLNPESIAREASSEATIRAGFDAAIINKTIEEGNALRASVNASMGKGVQLNTEA